ncbi:protein jag [Chloroflexota bacterium]
MTSEEMKTTETAATEVLGELLGHLELEGKVVAADPFMITGEEGEGTSVVLEIEGEDLGILIGRRGQTLAALQYVVRLVVNSKTGSKLPIVIDVEGYKRRRYEALRAFAWRMADEVRAKRVPFTMEPMSAFERRVVHLALADDIDVITQSTGQGDMRKVVIVPKGPLP